jgi:hypothetical protein
MLMRLARRAMSVRKSFLIFVAMWGLAIVSNTKAFGGAAQGLIPGSSEAGANDDIVRIVAMQPQTDGR